MLSLAEQVLKLKFARFCKVQNAKLESRKHLFMKVRCYLQNILAYE